MKILCLLLGSLVGLGIPSLADDVEVRAAFKKAAALMEGEKFEEALPLLKQVEKEYPEDLSVLWNLGLTLASLQKHQDGLEIWQRYQKLSPKEFPVYAKIVQAYQGLGKTKERNAAIQRAYDFRASLSPAEKKKNQRFCREQTVVAGKPVFAFEYMDPASPRKVFYRFSILKPDGTEEFYISLGSYDDTTEIAKGVGQIKAEDRLFHLDEYRPSRHTTYRFYGKKPDYDSVRADVVAVLEGKLKPMSSTTSRPEE